MNRREVLQLLPGAVLAPLLMQSAPAEGQDAAQPIDAWSIDRRVFVLDRSTESIQRYFIIGDIVELSAATFPSLFRDNGQYLSKTFELNIDARHAIFNMPLRMADGRLRIIAQRLEFGFDGLAGFVSPPSNGQLISISAEVIDFTRARSLPFAFRTGVEGRSINIRCLSATGLTPGAAPTNEFAHFIAQMTLGDAGGVRPDISFGDAAVSAYETSLANAKWPEASTLKLQRFLSNAPYSESNRAFVRGKVGELLTALRGTQSPLVSAAVQRTSDAIANQSDLLGLRENDTPMSSLSQSIERTDRLVKTLFDEGLLSTWDSIAITSANPASIDTVRFQDVAGARDAAARQLDELAAEGAKISVRLQTLEGLIGQTDKELENQKTFLAQQEFAIQQKGPNDNVAKGVGAIAAVGSVVFPAAAPFLMVASGMVSAAMEMSNNDGDFVSHITNIADIVKNHSELMKVSLQLRKDWDSVTGDFGLARRSVTDKRSLTPDEKKRVEQWKASASSLGNQVKAIAAILKSSPPSAELKDETATANSDPEIRTIILQRNDCVREQSDLLNRQISLAQELQVESARILELDAILAEMQQLALVNDDDRARYRMLADWARRSLIESIAKEAILLNRSLRYAGAPASDMPHELLSYAEGAAGMTASRFFIDSGETETELQQAAKKREAIYRTLLLDARGLRDSLIEKKRWNIPSPITVSARRKDNPGTPAHQARMEGFVRDLNRIIADAIREGKSQPVPIPFNPGDIQHTTNAFLLGINIARLELAETRAPDGEFILYIGHPRFGKLVRNGGEEFFTDFVRDRRNNALNSAYWPLRLPNDVEPDWQKRILFAQELAKIQDTMLPLLTSYEVHVEVANRDEWSTVPQIERIDLEFISVGGK
ncbi:hypothetical protein EJ079_02830 [Mesorhizobium sp. M7A.F.Ce.TU.012.03.2.1]|nr:hypothetical protein EJ079_02830 [Mesorhizobium sp. M7A.F.Ce.TU.012.03.2.1]